MSRYLVPFAIVPIIGERMAFRFFGITIAIWQRYG